MSIYGKAVVACASGLAIKAGALNLLTVRARILTGDFATGRPTKAAWKEDTVIPEWVGMIFACATGAILGGPTPTVERFSGLVANAEENEPFFLALAIAVGAFSTPHELAPTFVYTYLAGRYFHALVYLVDFPKMLLPYKTLIRAVGFLAGTFSMFGLAATALNAQ